MLKTCYNVLQDHSSRLIAYRLWFWLFSQSIYLKEKSSLKQMRYTCIFITFINICDVHNESGGNLLVIFASFLFFSFSLFLFEVRGCLWCHRWTLQVRLQRCLIGENVCVISDISDNSEVLLLAPETKEQELLFSLIIFQRYSMGC